MSNYDLILIWILIFGILGMHVQMQRKEMVLGKEVKRYQPFWAAVLAAPLVIWTANRGYVIDTGAYIQMFSELPASMSEIGSYMNTVEKDKGFYLLSALIKCLISKDEKVYFFLLAVLQTYILFRLYRKYSMRYVISFFLFIASTDYVSWMFNGIRQFTAVAFTLLAFEPVLEKKYVKAIMIVLFASLFHQSALLVIPFIFIVQGKAWNKKTILIITIVIVAVAYIDPFIDFLGLILQETQYMNVISEWNALEDDGTNRMRVFVYAVPTLLSLAGLKQIRRENSRVINLCTNMSIISMCIYIISMVTSGIFIGRLPIYFSLYNYILLPWEIENLFEKKSSAIVYGIMIAAYLFFYYYQIHLTWGFG